MCSTLPLTPSPLWSVSHARSRSLPTCRTAPIHRVLDDDDDSAAAYNSNFDPSAPSSSSHPRQHHRRAGSGGGESDMSDSAGSASSHGKSTKAGAASKRKGNPLRRGDACLMCRAKKLKCSATKPVCNQCHKRNDRCVYDALRPASRVEKLERKLAEIEDAEFKAALASRRHSEVSTPQGYKPPFTAETAPRAPLSGSLDSGLYGYPPNNGPATAYGPPNNAFPANDRPNTASSSFGGTPVIGPGVVDAWSFSDPFAAPPHLASAPNSAVQVDSLPWPLLSASNDVSTLWGSTSSYLDMEMEMDGMEMNFDFDSLNTDPAQMVFPPPAFMASNSTASAVPQPPSSTAPGAGGAADAADAVIDDVLAHATNYTGVQLLESDISQSARDYLLDLFFCPPRTRAGSEPWSEQQFRARMISPNTRQRPHPGLLFAMYTVAASSSYIPAVRALADSLYEIAARKIDEAVSQEDRLLDCINAMKMLGKWLFSKARALEAYNLTWKAVSLVHACQLDKITTGKYSPEMSKGGRTQENPWPLLGPPRDQWDLCERIHAFWGVWGNVRGAAIMLPWPTPIHDETILTPLPYPPEHYLDGTIHSLPDINLRDVYEWPHNLAQPINFSYALLLVSVHLLHRAKTLRDQPPPQAETTYRSRSRLALASAGTAARSVRIENQAAYTEIMDAAKYIQANLPSEVKLDMMSATPWTNPEIPMILVCLIGVRMHLHDPEGDEYDREACMSAAREAAAIVKLWIRQLKLDDHNLAGAGISGDGSTKSRSSRNKNGVAGPYVLVPWFWTANRLIRCARVLRKLGPGGREQEAADLEVDAGLVIQGLKDQGVLYPMASDSADLIEKAV